MSNIELIAIVIFAFIGASFGSFAGVAIDRLFADKPGIFFGRSRCDHTGKLLRWWEMIPVLSYLGLRGRSAHNGKRIPFWYLLLEVSFAVVFGLFSYKFFPVIANGNGVEPAIILAMLFAALLLFFYDAKHFLVDRRISFPAIGCALLWALFRENTIDLLIGGAIGFAFYWLQWKISDGKWVGEGDQELGLFMGLILGWQGVLWALLVAYMVGTVIAVGLMIGNKNVGMKSALPMGAFLMPALMAFLLFEPEMWQLYDFFFGI